MSSSYDSALVDTATVDDPRLVALPRGIRLLHIEALVWSKLRRTDGLVPRASLHRMTDEPDAESAADQLAAAGVWESAPGGWQIVGFTDAQMSAARVREKQESAKARYDNWQQSHRGKRVANAVANDSARPAPPARKGRGQVGGNGVGALEPPPPATDEELHVLRQTRSNVEALDWYRPSEERSEGWSKL